MKAFVTGATGFVGAVDWFRTHGYVKGKAA